MDGTRAAAEEPTPVRLDTRFPPEVRVRLGSDIRRVFSKGKRSRTRHLDVVFAASPVSHSRFGVIVPKHRNRIVDRNLLKRRLREIGRREVLPRLRSRGVEVDLLVRARREAYAVGFDDLRRELVEWVDRTWSEGS
jgi:ribonuclease P protein component